MSDNRAHLEEKYTWDLSTIFSTNQEFEVEIGKIEEDIVKAEAFKGKVIQSSKHLLEITELQLELSRRIENAYVYASMKNDQDTTVSKYQEYQSKASALYAKFSEAFAYFEPEFLAISEERYEQFLEENIDLQSYKHFFDRVLTQKGHVLSEREEALLASAGEIFSSASETFEILDNADILFPLVKNDLGEEVELSHGSYVTLLESKNRQVRQGAYQGMYSIYEQYQHTYAKTLQTNVKVHNFKATAHHYQTAREAAMAANHIPEIVYDNLIKAVNDHLPLLHRYVNLRKKLLGLDDLKMYDMYTPLSDYSINYKYDEALEKAENVLSIFGKDYSERVHRAFTERWIDVYENKGKRSGAYSGGAYDTNAFMLLNWQDNLDNLFTLVHETGHSMHSTFTRENQDYVYGDYSIFLAEIASTTNEAILTEVLLNEAKTDKERFALLNHFLDGFKGTVFRQTQFAEFEDTIHKADQEGQVLTSEFMNQLYADLNERYYGLSKEENSEIQYEWARIPHFYYNYYVYQYATGFSAAIALSDKIINGDESDKEAYLDYLKAGNSDYPINVISKAGVDMTGTDYLNSAFKVFEERLNELEALIEKGQLD